MRKMPLIFPSLLLMAVSLGIFLPGCGSGGNTNIYTSDSSADNSSTATFLVSSEADQRISDRKFEMVPTIAATANGKLLYVAWYSGGAAAGPGNYVTLSVSRDMGSTWLNDQFVVFPKVPSNRIFDPALWRDMDGQIHLFYGSSKDSLLWDGRGGVNSVEINWDGSKIAYSNPKRLADGVMSNKPIYLASKGIGLFPVYIDKPSGPDSNGIAYPENGAFILSHNYENSKKIDILKSYSSIKIPEEIRIHDEPQLVEISGKGELLALVRTTKGIYFSRSTDYGKSWSVVEPFTASGPTTSSRFYIGKLASGNLLLVSNNSTTRNNMVASLSKDGGKTWPYKLLLDGRENVSYPDADQTIDGNIHVVFDRDRTGSKDILYCRFTEDEIVNVRPENIFKARVNKP